MLCHFQRFPLDACKHIHVRLRLPAAVAIPARTRMPVAARIKELQYPQNFYKKIVLK